MNKLAMAVLAVMAVLAIAGSSFGQGQPGQESLLTNTDKLAKAVGLNDNQVKKLKEIEADHEKAMAHASAALEANRTALQDAVKNGDTDKQAAVLDERQKLNAKSKDISQKYEESRTSVLTDDQKAKLKGADEAQTAGQMADVAAQIRQQISKVCDLSDDEMKAMLTICLAGQKVMEQRGSENADKLEVNQLAQMVAKANGDWEKLAMLEAQAEEFQAAAMDLGGKCATDMFAVMKDDQRAKLLGYFLTQNGLGNFEVCDLTDAQKTQAKGMCHAIVTEKNATVMSICTKFEQEVFSKILTDDQKAKLLQQLTLLRVGRMYPAFRFADNQMGKIKDAYALLVANKQTVALTTIKDLKGMNDAAMDIFKKLSPQIEALLTNEQKAMIEKWKTPAKTATTRPANK
jgi:Tfp pilus assembly protein FimT